jgi:hypothetical protein
VPDDESPDPTPITEVEITVGGHAICVKAPAPMAEVADQALRLYRQTALPARDIPFGFDATSSQVELREQPDLGYRLAEPDGPEEDHARLGRINPQGPIA